MTTPTLQRIKAKVMSQIDAFHEACVAADNWAKVSSKKTFVVRNNGRYFIADMADLRQYHRRDIHRKRASVVYIGHSMPAAFGVLDADYAPVGWDN